MKRKAVLFIVITLVSIGVLAAPSPPSSQGAVASVLNQVTPTAQCQHPDRCPYVRSTCYKDWYAYFRFCKELTGDVERCDAEFNAGYKACAGHCW